MVQRAGAALRAGRLLAREGIDGHSAQRIRHLGTHAARPGRHVQGDGTPERVFPAADSRELHEEGGHTKVNSNGVVEIVHWAPGSKRTPGNNATVPLFNGTIATSNDGILDYWHIHPSGTTYGTDSNGNSISTNLLLDHLE